MLMFRISLIVDFTFLQRFSKSIETLHSEESFVILDSFGGQLDEIGISLKYLAVAG